MIRLFHALFRTGSTGGCLVMMVVFILAIVVVVVLSLLIPVPELVVQQLLRNTNNKWWILWSTLSSYDNHHNNNTNSSGCIDVCCPDNPLFLPPVVSATNNTGYIVPPQQQRLLQHHKTQTELHTGWTACHASAVIDPALGCTLQNARRRNSSNDSNNKHNASTTSQPLPFVLLNVSKLPTTAMAVLIDNQQIIAPTTGTTTTTRGKQTSSVVTMNTLYESQNIASIPDIHRTGRDYYTLLYQIEIPTINCCFSGNGTTEIAENDTAAAVCIDDQQKLYLTFAGINYRATVWYNGQRLPNLQYRPYHSFRTTTSTTSSSPPPPKFNVPGMFVRHRYDLSQSPQSRSNLPAVATANLFVVMIEPPFHPGYSPNTNSNEQQQQQGGSHDLAKDGAIPQYMLGWDWCTSMPDRATGFYGTTTLERYLYTRPNTHSSTGIGLTTTKVVARDESHKNINNSNKRYTKRIGNSIFVFIHDPTIQTVDLKNCTWNHHRHYKCTGITLRILLHVEWSSIISNEYESDWTTSDVTKSTKEWNTITLSVSSDWGEIWNITCSNCNGATTTGDGFIDLQEKFTVQQTNKVQLWWPHGIGISNYAHLHNFTVTVYSDDVVATDTVTIAVGVRTIETYLDQTIQGQRFRINHHDIYLIGGNWIGTDQALRFSASKQRYCNEVLLHQHAGFNLIRVWGGSTAERDAFYECTDQYGILVYQEFWMTGDNNGRWAGNYSWPLDYDSYLVNVEDTIRRLRCHPSLLFYGGCNECLSSRESPWAPNPPRPIDDGTRLLIDKFDPGRFYISSSMGGPNLGDTFYEPSMYHNRTFSLAYGDGPYGMLLPSTFFDRNPGQPYKNCSIGFQPEIGSVSVPTMNGMLKFLSKQEIDQGYPRRDSRISVGDDWIFHNFQSWTTVLPSNESYDHVYAYFGPNRIVNAADWIAAAQLAAHAQYQYLCSGFISRIFNYTSGVVVWKTQSPWPSLRGFLYDWYLESTGMMTGVRSALWSPISVVFDPKSWQLHVVNRQIFSMSCEQSKIGVKYTWIDIHGTSVSFGNTYLHHDTMPPMSAMLLQIDHQTKVSWPILCTDVCFLRLEGIGGCEAVPTSWYWLTNPDKGDAGIYSLLGEMRSRPSNSFHWSIEKCGTTDGKTLLKLLLQLHHEAHDLVFHPTFAIYRQSDNSQLLPLLDLNDTNLVILPGTTQLRILESPVHVVSGEILVIKVSGWNIADEVQSITC